MKKCHLVWVVLLALVFGFSSAALAKNPAILSTEDAPAAVGPYSQGVKLGNLVFPAGQIALIPGTAIPTVGGNKIAGVTYNEDGSIRSYANDTITQQTTQVMKNLLSILKEAKLTFNDVVMTTVYLADLKDFDEFNRQYAIALGCKVYDLYGKWVFDCVDVHLPARATIGGVAIPGAGKGAKLEVSMIAGK